MKVKLKRLGIIVVAFLVASPAMADFSDSIQAAREDKIRAENALEEECREMYHEIFFFFAGRYDGRKTKEEARESYLSQRYLDTSVMSKESIEGLLGMLYDTLPDAPADSFSSRQMARDVALTYYSVCVGVLNKSGDSPTSR